MSGITNWGTDLGRVPSHSVRAVNAAIQAYAMGKGPMVDVGVVETPGTAPKLCRVTRVRTRNGQAQGKLLSSGRWVNIRGVLMQ